MQRAQSADCRAPETETAPPEFFRYGGLGPKAIMLQASAGLAPLCHARVLFMDTGLSSMIWAITVVACRVTIS